jgi:hypothetical protein
MLEVGWFSTKLLLKGKLLRNPEYFWKGTAIGIGIGFLLLVGLKQAGMELWLTIPLSAFVTGIVMPFLFKDVKMQ